MIMDGNRNRRTSDEFEVIHNTNDSCKHEKNFKENTSINDKKSICLLIFLYILQGIPLGLAGSVPLILQSYHVSYTTQAYFSFSFWPFSLKILWAPFVDSMFVTRWGRRKTWLIPTQLLIGVTLLVVSANVSHWLVAEIKIIPLTFSFFILNLLAATQDIAVDGWALTMLSRNSVGWASTCNSVGQTAGYFIAFILFLSLDSAEFCNNWLRSKPDKVGLVTFSGFLYFWGVTFLVATLLVMIFKSERKSTEISGEVDIACSSEVELSLRETYSTLWRIMKLNPIRMYVVSLVLVKIGFSATDHVTVLKLIEKGVSKESMALVGSLLVPLQIVLALFISKYTVGSLPLSIFVHAILPRLLFGPVFALVVHHTPHFQSHNGSYTASYYGMLTSVYATHQLFVYPMFVSSMAFCARISDPSIGGTYMTLLNTVSNLASSLPGTLMLYLVDHLTIRRCIGGQNNGLSCLSKSDINVCAQPDPRGTCTIIIDGYYLEIGLCFCIGVVALVTRKRYLLKAQLLPPSVWKVSKSSDTFHSRTNSTLF